MPIGDLSILEQGNVAGSEEQNPWHRPHTDVSTETFRNPRFLHALRAEAQARGKSFDNDEDLIRWFERGRTFADMNTASSAADYLRARQADPERRERQRYLQDTWNRLPWLMQEGGRGWGGVGDNLLAIATDPLNFVAGLGLIGNAAKGAQLAARAGKSGAWAGAKAGARRGALNEGILSGVAEGVIDTFTQKRDIELGLQDEFSYGQLGAATAFGGAVGAGAGGLIGGGIGVAAARPAARTAEELGRLGYADDVIDAMPWEQQQATVAAGRPASTAEGSTGTAEAGATKEAVAPLTPEEERAARYDAHAREVSSETESLRSEIVELRRDGADPEVIAEREATLNAMARLRQFPERFKAEDAEISHLEASSDLAKQAEARRRRAAFEREMADFETALDARSAAEAEAAVQRMDQPLEQRLLTYQPREDGVSASVDQAVPAGRPMGEAVDGQGIAPQGRAPEPDITQGAEAETLAPEPYQPSFKYANPQAEAEAEARGLTARDVEDLIDRGVVVPGPKGVGVRNLRKANRAISEYLAERDAPPTPEEVAPAADAPATEAPTQAPADPPPNLADFRGRLLDMGVDPRAVQGTGQDGRLTKKDIRALRGSPRSEYAEQVQSDLDRVMQAAESMGIDQMPDILPEYARIIMSDAQFRPTTSADDVASLLWRRIQDGRLGGSEAQVRDTLTTTEQKRVRNIAQHWMQRNPELSREEAESIALARVLANRADKTPSSQPRTASGEAIDPRTFRRSEDRLGSSAAIERASQYESAGRTNQGRVQEQLRRGMPSERDAEGNVTRTVTRTGLERNESVYQGKSTFDREGAGIQARTNTRINAEMAEARQKATRYYTDYASMANELGMPGGTRTRQLYDEIVAKYYDPVQKAFKVKVGKIAREYRGRFHSKATTAGVRGEADIKDVRAVIQRIGTTARYEGMANRQPLPEIVPYVTQRNERIYSDHKTGAQIEVPQGTTVWVEGRSGKIYRSVDEALFARGDLRKDQQAAAANEGVAPEKAPEAEVATGASEAIAAFLRALPPDADPADALAQMKRLIARQAGEQEMPRLPEEGPEAPEGMLPIMRRKDGTGKIRIMSPEQKAAGKSIRDVLGSQRPEDWEVRYIPESGYSMRASAKERLFAEAALADETVVPATLRPPIDYAEYAEMSVGQQMTDGQYAAYQQAAGSKLARKIGLRADAPRERITGKMLRAAIHAVEYQPDSLVGRTQQFDQRLAVLEQLYDLEGTLAPNGIVRPTTTRAAAKETLDDILSAYDAPTRKAATRLIDRLAGGSAPLFRGSDSAGSTAYQTRFEPGDADDNVVRLQRQAGEADSLPALPKLYHEVFHWAWDNVLTPSDRLEVARYIRTQFFAGEQADISQLMQASSITPDGARAGGAANSLDSIGEFAADQFSQWAMRARTAPEAQSEAVWQRLANYIKAVFDRYMYGRPIDPALEQIFSKVLPEDQRLRLQHGTAEPKTRFGEAVQRRYRELHMVRTDLEDAMRSGNDTRIIEAGRALRDYLNSLSMSRGTAAAMARRQGTQERTSGAFSAINPILKLVRQRQSDLHEVLTGRGLPEEYINDTTNKAALDPDLLFGAEIGRDPTRIADQIVEIYDHGHAAPAHGVEGFRPSTYVPDNNIEATPVFRTLQEIEAILESAFERAEGTALGRSRANREHAAPDPSAADVRKRVKGKAKRAQSQEQRTAEEAAREARTEPGKRRKADPGKRPEVDQSEARSPRNMSTQELVAEYERQRGTARGAQIAHEILRKAKAEPPPAEKVDVPRPIMEARKDDLERMLTDALDQGGPESRATVNQIIYEMQRRGERRRLKGTSAKVMDAIRHEVEANEGVPRAEGVPPNADTFTREALTSMTHRDSEVQYTMRTMLYRMLNLMGKATRKSLGDVNVMSTEDLVRLGNYDINEVLGAAQFADFTHPAYAHLRSKFRKLSMGLSKGSASPMDVMHEIGHVVSRAVLAPEDRARIVGLYRSADDDLKRRIHKEYGKHYANWDYSPSQLEEVLAEEWFAEGLARYASERVSRSDAFNIGTMPDVSLRSRIDTIVDNAIEYIAYIVNGLIGRNDIKQEFRRLAFYGDMFGGYEQPVRNAYARRAGVAPDVAADYAAESLRHAPKRKVNRIMDFVRGHGLTEDGKPRVWYHGTPNGKSLRKDTAPDAILQPSKSGLDGPGIYLTLSPRVASKTYAENATPIALKQMAREQQLADPEIEYAIDELHSIRSALAMKRREREMLEMSQADDEISQVINAGVMRDIESDILDFARMEQGLVDELAMRGLEVDPYVAPIYVRTDSTADFSKEGQYYAGDAFVSAFLRKARDMEMLDNETIRDVLDAFDSDRPMNGNRLKRMLMDALDDQQGGKKTHAILRELGYDSIKSTHYNRVADNDVFGDPVAHDVLVVFDPERVKHVDADLFDADDARLYYRDMEGAPVNPSGPLLRSMYLGRGLDETSPAQIGMELEMGGVDAPIIDAVMNIAKRKTVTDNDLKQVRRTSMAMSALATQSAKMRHIGANWVADWFQPHFSDVQQSLAAQWRPIEKLLQKLPDAYSPAKRWAIRSSNVTRGLAARQPRSHLKIVKALRRADDTRLSEQERKVYNAVRHAFDQAYEQMKKAGVYVGHRKNYFPQVWNPDAIRKNQAKFLADMADYYVMENTQNGREVTTQQANEFAQKIYQKLSNDMEDVVHFPVDAQSSASPGDSIDFNRLIELDKYPGMVERMEPYLESNLEAIMHRYLDASTRRTKITEKFGFAAHGLKDYMMVMQEGVEGIARLLSTNRVVQKDTWFRNLTGEVELGQLTDVTRMPFSDRSPQEAREYAELLAETRRTKGQAAVREMLESIAPRNDDGEVPLAYKHRAEAILGALNDYQGELANVAAKEYDMLNNAMRAANKRPLADSAFGGMGMVHATRAIRNFNAITYLSWTTLTSFSDLILPGLRSGNLGAWVKGLTHMARDPEYAELIRSTGIAIENQLHERLTGLHGGASSHVANAFFNATLLSPWTDMNRRMAGVTGHESFKAMQRQAFKYHKPGVPSAQQPEKYQIAHRMLHKYGLRDFLPGGAKEDISLSDNMLLRDDESVRRAVLQFADESIFQPNADDIPLWAQTPIGGTIFQLNTFPLMMGRMAKEVLLDDLAQFARTGERQYLKRPALFLSLGPAFGATTLAAKDIAQSRGGEDFTESALRVRNAGTAPFMSWVAEHFGFDPETDEQAHDMLGWYFEGMTQLGGFGLILEIMHDVAAHADHGAYGKTRIASAIGGPSVGTMFSAIDVGAGITDAAFGDGSSNAKFRQGVREAVRRVPVIGGMGGPREGIVDSVAGEAAKRGGGSSSAGFSGGFGSGGFRGNF